MPLLYDCSIKQRNITSVLKNITTINGNKISLTTRNKITY